MLGRFFSGKTADEITPKLCDSYVEWRIRQGDARKHARRGTRLLAPATARCDLTVLKAAINFCYRERKLAVAVPVKLPKSSEPRPRCLSVSEAARLLRAALGWDQNGRRQYEKDQPAPRPLYSDRLVLRHSARPHSATAMDSEPARWMDRSRTRHPASPCRQRVGNQEARPKRPDGQPGCWRTCSAGGS